MKNNNYGSMTNTEFVNELMDGYSKYGALSQMVMVEAIEKGLEYILKDKDAVVAEYKEQAAKGQFHFINMEHSWVQPQNY